MKLLTFITKGQVQISSEGMRCMALRENGRVCHKMICKKNNLGQIAGDFQCERCKQNIQVTLRAAKEDQV
jgi:hypothetical protein